MVYKCLLDGYYKVMSNIPKMGHLPTPARLDHVFFVLWHGKFMIMINMYQHSQKMMIIMMMMMMMMIEIVSKMMTINYH